MMRPQFARDQVSDLDLEERHVQNMMRSLDISMQSDKWTGVVDLQVLFFRLTLDSATEFLFGQSVESQLRLLPNQSAKKVDDQADDFAVAFDRGQMALATRARFMVSQNPFLGANFLYNLGGSSLNPPWIALSCCSNDPIFLRFL
jgi:hypothetical protein